MRSYASVATLALFLSLGGGAYAAVTITGRNVANGTLTGKDVRNESIRSADVGGLRATDFAPGQLPAGPKGDKGDKGDAGPPAQTGPGARVRMTARQSSTANGNRGTWIEVNGILRGTTRDANALLSASQSVTTVDRLQRGDAVRLRGIQDSGAGMGTVNATGTGHAYLSFQWLAP